MPEKKKKYYIYDPKDKTPYGPFEEQEAVDRTSRFTDLEIWDEDQIKAKFQPPKRENAELEDIDKDKPWWNNSKFNGPGLAKNFGVGAVTGGLAGIPGGPAGIGTGALIGGLANTALQDSSHEYSVPELALMAAAPPAGGKLLDVAAKATSKAGPMTKVLAQVGTGLGSELGFNVGQRVAEDKFSGTKQGPFPEPSVGNLASLFLAGAIPGAGQAIKNSNFMKSRNILGDKVKDVPPSQMADKIIDDQEFSKVIDSTLGRDLRTVNLNKTENLDAMVRKMADLQGESDALKKRIEGLPGTQDTAIQQAVQDHATRVQKEQQKYQETISRLSPESKEKLQQYLGKMTSHEKARLEYEATQKAYDNFVNSGTNLRDPANQNTVRQMEAQLAQKKQNFDTLTRENNYKAIDKIIMKESGQTPSDLMKVQQQGIKIDQMMDEPFNSVKRIENQFKKDRIVHEGGLVRVDTELSQMRKDVDNQTMLNARVAGFLKQAESPAQVFSKIIESDNLADVSSFFDYMKSNHKVSADELSKALVSQLFKEGFDPNTRTLSKLPELFTRHQDLKPKLRLLFGSNSEADRVYNFISLMGDKSVKDQGTNIIVDGVKVFMKVASPKTTKASLIKFIMPDVASSIAKNDTFYKTFMGWIEKGMPESAIAQGTYLYNQLIRNANVAGKKYKFNPQTGDLENEEQER